MTIPFNKLRDSLPVTMKVQANSYELPDALRGRLVIFHLELDNSCTVIILPVAGQSEKVPIEVRKKYFYNGMPKSIELVLEEHDGRVWQSCIPPEYAERVLHHKEQRKLAYAKEKQK